MRNGVENFAELFKKRPIGPRVLSRVKREKGDAEPDSSNGSVQVVADPDRYNLKRLTRDFVRKPKTEGLAILSLGSAYLFVPTVIEGRIAPKEHSHSKFTWRERNPGHDYRPRHILALERSGVHLHELNGHTEHQGFTYEPATAEDWASLERVNNAPSVIPVEDFRALLSSRI